MQDGWCVAGALRAGWAVGELRAGHAYITYAGNRYAAREIAEIRGCGVGRIVRQCHRMKTRGQGAGNTPTALTHPPSTPEGGAVMKLKALLYATHREPAVVIPGAPVANPTVLVVAS